MKKYNGTEIAIIGMSCQFPGASDSAEYWQNLQEGKESITRFSKEQLLAAGIPEERINDPDYVAARGEPDGAEYFDASFFGFRPVEAEIMDPQMRVFFQHCWKAIEEAAYDLTAFEDKIGLFAGAAPNINWENAAIINNNNGEVDDVTAGQLRNVAYMSTRVSHNFNLTGPSIYMNTTCSSSLVAIQRACMSLLLRECKMALAGGIFLTNYPDRGYKYHDGFIYSTDGYCRAFDEKANGTVAGEGGGVVLLKRLEDAIKDRDPIHAVIKGSAINNDGSQKASYTAPGSEGQQEVIMKALKMAKVPKESIGYIEAHGTGTALGDVIEMDALRRVYGDSETPYCGLGSVKTNIGHLISASGVAGLIKTVMALKNKQIPATLNLDTLNPKFNMERSPFYVNDKLKDWETTDTPRRAGVSSFGIGGTNAHVILEEWNAPIVPENSPRPELLVFSGKSESALNNNMSSLGQSLSKHPETNLANVAMTLRMGRVALDYRKTIVASTNQQAIEQLTSPDYIPFAKLTTKAKMPLVFMFSGQGSQYARMADELKRFEVFKLAVGTCFKLLKAHTGKDFQRIWEQEELVNETENSQPLLFVLEYAVAKLLVDLDMMPDILVGHSIGEYAAACISGMISLEDALKLVVKRGELMRQAQPGDMLSISLRKQDLLPHLETHKDLKLAASNSTTLNVVSGTTEAIAKLQEALENQGVKTRLLITSHAFHSELMRPAVSPFFNEVRNVKFKTGKIPVISSKTGQLVTSEMLDPGYWSDQIVDEVQFSRALEYILKEDAVLIEVGPGDALTTFARTHQMREQQPVFASIPKYSDETSADVFFLKTIGKLWGNGFDPYWSKLQNDEAQNRIHLPTYQFDKVAYPHRVDAEKTIRNLITKGNGIHNDVNDWLHQSSWQVADEIEELTNTQQHLIIQADPSQKINLQVQFPQAVFVEFGEAFEQSEGQQYVLNPESQQGFTQLLKELRFDGHISISYFLKRHENSGTEEAIKHNYQSLIQLTKALGNVPQLDSIRVTLVSFGSQPIVADDKVDPFQSLAIGVGRVINKEYYHIQTRCVDFTNTDDRWPQQLQEELSGEERLVAYRGGIRFSQSYKRTSIKSEVAVDRLKNGATYLITGGTGGIGLALANRIAKEYQEITFIMFGRRKLPEKTTWASSEDLVISKFAEIEGLGATIHYFSVDIGNQQEVDKAFAQTEVIGTIDGVIHAAGSVDMGGIIQNRQAESDENLFAAKVHGTLHLIRALDVSKLDFFLLCSSSAAVKAPAGEVAYVATNTFLNGISASFPNVKSMGWNAWSESGMALNVGRINEQNSVTDEEGYRLFKKAISAKARHLVVSSYDLEDEPEEKEEEDQEVNIEMITDSTENASVEQRLIKLWETFFGKQDINPLDNFFEIGGDSLKALTMINWIKDEFGIIITVQSFFEYDTIKGLSNYLEISLTDQREEEDTYDVIEI